MEDKNFSIIQRMFPNKDRALIEELMTECRDPDDVIQRLKNDDESANWKKNQTKSKKINYERPSKNGPKRQPRENKTPPPPAKNAKEPAGALLQRRKQTDFGPASNATWGDIKEVNGEIISTAEPVQPKQQPAKPQERTAPVQQEASAPANQQQTNQQNSGQQHQNNKRNQATHNINPENIQQQPQQTQPENQNQQQQNQAPTKNENANVKSQKPKSASLFLPVSLNNITPDLSKFGVFAGPLPQEAPKHTPQLACVSIQPTYVVPLRQKVLISNQLHHFEIKRPPSPPPQPKVQPPALATHETQTTAPIPAQKEEQPSEIQQQQLQQQVPVSQASSMPTVAPNAPIGPIGSQPVVFNYPYAPFAFPYPQYDPASTQQAQQPLTFIQYPPYNQGYPIPYPIPGYPPMQPAMPQGVQQPQQPQAQAQAPAQNQQQQQQQQNQRQIPKNYNNNKPQYTDDQRQGYNYNNTQNNRASYQPPIPQNRPNANFQ